LKSQYNIYCGYIATVEALFCPQLGAQFTRTQTFSGLPRFSFFIKSLQKLILQRRD